MQARVTKLPLRIAVLLSGAGTSLENLFAHIEGGRLAPDLARISVVIASKRDAGGLARAERHGTPAVAIPRREFESSSAFNDALHDALEPHNVGLVALLGFLSIFEPRARYAGKVINVHPALIPAFCGKGFYGARVHRAVLEAGVKVSGATVHFADDQYDTGPIILQEAVPVLASDSPDSLAARVQAAERRLVPEAIRLFAQGRLQIEGRGVKVLR